jgi:hypothetical protein
VLFDLAGVVFSDVVECLFCGFHSGGKIVKRGIAAVGDVFACR